MFIFMFVCIPSVPVYLCRTACLLVAELCSAITSPSVREKVSDRVMDVESKTDWRGERQAAECVNKRQAFTFV